MVGEFEGVVLEFTPVLIVNRQVKEGYGKVTLLTGHTYDFNEKHCVGDAVPSKGDQAVIQLQHIPDTMPTVMSVRCYSLRS